MDNKFQRNGSYEFILVEGSTIEIMEYETNRQGLNQFDFSGVDLNSGSNPIIV